MEPPWPSGTLVRTKRVADVPLYLACGDHILEAYGDAAQVDYGCGWVQSMRCLVCGRTTAALDVVSWWELADEAYLLDRIDWLNSEIQRAEKARDRMTDRLKNPGYRPISRDLG